MTKVIYMYIKLSISNVTISLMKHSKVLVTHITKYFPQTEDSF